MESRLLTTSFPAWTTMVDRYNKTQPVPLELLIVNANTRSDLCLELPVRSMPAKLSNSQAWTTPVATPNPSGPAASPEQLGTAPTPTSGVNISVNPPTPTETPVETDSESQLIDLCDESWGVVLSHRANNTPHLTEYRPALASGYLLRRKGTTDGDGILAMSVNLVYTQRGTPAYESLLKEILGIYRELSCLARAKGTRHVQRNTMPWHIATAVRGREILSYVL